MSNDSSEPEHVITDEDVEDVYLSKRTSGPMPKGCFYKCTSGCGDEQVFTSRTLWIDHEERRHGVTWVCGDSGCTSSFRNFQTYTRHKFEAKHSVMMARVREALVSGMSVAEGTRIRGVLEKELALLRYEEGVSQEKMGKAAEGSGDTSGKGRPIEDVLMSQLRREEEDDVDESPSQLEDPDSQHQEPLSAKDETLTQIMSQYSSTQRSQRIRMVIHDTYMSNSEDPDEETQRDELGTYPGGQSTRRQQLTAVPENDGGEDDDDGEEDHKDEKSNVAVPETMQDTQSQIHTFGASPSRIRLPSSKSIDKDSQPSFFQTSARNQSVAHSSPPRHSYSSPARPATSSSPARPAPGFKAYVYTRKRQLELKELELKGKRARLDAERALVAAELYDVKLEKKLLEE